MRKIVQFVLEYDPLHASHKVVQRLDVPVCERRVQSRQHRLRDREMERRGLHRPRLGVSLDIDLVLAFSNSTPASRAGSPVHQSDPGRTVRKVYCSTSLYDSYDGLGNVRPVSSSSRSV